MVSCMRKVVFVRASHCVLPRVAAPARRVPTADRVMIPCSHGGKEWPGSSGYPAAQWQALFRPDSDRHNDAKGVRRSPSSAEGSARQMCEPSSWGCIIP